MYHNNLPQPNLLQHYSPTHSEGRHSRKLTKSLTTTTKTQCLLNAYVSHCFPGSKYQTRPNLILRKMDRSDSVNTLQFAKRAKMITTPVLILCLPCNLSTSITMYTWGKKQNSMFAHGKSYLSSQVKSKKGTLWEFVNRCWMNDDPVFMLLW